MYYFIYLTHILKIYVMIRYLHGAYISYYFLQWVLTSVYSNFIWILSFIHKPHEQIEDKYNLFEYVDGYIVIY